MRDVSGTSWGVVIGNRSVETLLRSCTCAVCAASAFLTPLAICTAVAVVAVVVARAAVAPLAVVAGCAA